MRRAIAILAAVIVLMGAFGTSLIKSERVGAEVSLVSPLAQAPGTTGGYQVVSAQPTSGTAPLGRSVGAAGPDSATLPVAMVSTSANAVSNPGFESGVGSQPSNWSWYDYGQNPANYMQWVTDTVHSGSHAVKMTVGANPYGSAHSSIGLVSSQFTIPSDWSSGVVQISAWVQAQNITKADSTSAGWEYAFIRAEVYDATGTMLTAFWFGPGEGSITSWRRIGGLGVMPAGSSSMRVFVMLDHSTGTMWVDDVDVHLVQSMPQANTSGIYNPIVLPQPWSMTNWGSKLPIGSVAIVNSPQDVNTHDEMDAFLTGAGITHAFVSAGDPTLSTYQTVVLFGDSSNAAISQRFAAVRPSNSWQDIGQEGYFLSVQPGSQTVVYVGANSEKGRFYGIETFKQIVIANYLYVVDILDRPTLSRRGIIMPSEWYYSQRDDATIKSAEQKYNFIWNQGVGRLGTDDDPSMSWRNPFTSDDLTYFWPSYLKLASKRFIDLYVSMQPRGKNPATTFSSDADINLAVSKFDALYSLGIRNFGLSFDDLEATGENVLLVPQDITFFGNDIGQAHAYFTKEVYNRLKALHPDIHFMVVPMRYDQPGNFTDTALSSQRGTYLQHFGALNLPCAPTQTACTPQPLPSEIEVLETEYLPGDVDMPDVFSGRPSVIWSNFYATAYASGAEPANVLPYVDTIAWSDSTEIAKNRGFAYLPRTIATETSMGISWNTTSDLAWGPDRYNPGQSYQMAVARYQGVPDLTVTPTATPQATSTSTATSTGTATPQATGTPTATSTGTATPQATSTSTATSTGTATPQATSTSTATSTGTATPQATSTPTATSTPNGKRHRNVRLSPNTFNPLQGVTTASYDLSTACPTTFAAIVDLRTGSPVQLWKLGYEGPGLHTLRWTGTGITGTLVPEGVYAPVVTCQDQIGQTQNLGYDLAAIDSAIAGVTISPETYNQGGGYATLQFTNGLESSYTKVTVLSRQGKVVRDLPFLQSDAGVVTVTWDGRDNSGKLVPVGPYLLVVSLANPTYASQMHVELARIFVGG